MQKASRVATRIGLAQHDAQSQSGGGDHHLHGCNQGVRKRQEWQLALGWLSTMTRPKVTAETITYIAANSACEKRQEWQLALGWLSTITRAKVEMLCPRKLGSFSSAS